MKRRQKFMSLALSLAMALSLAVPAFASEIDAPGGGNSEAVLTQEQTSFSVTVPTGLPVDVASDGTITVAADAEIRNNGFGPVEVSAASVVPQNGWTLVGFGTDFTTKKVGLHEFGFQLQGNNVGMDGSCSVEGFPVIPGEDASRLNYDANVAVQQAAADGKVVANVVFTLGWAADESGAVQASPESWFKTDGVGTITGFSREYETLGDAAPTDIVIPSSVDGVATTAIGNGAFKKLSGITSVNIPDGVTSIGGSAFFGCRSLTSVTIPNSVMSIGSEAFNSCSNLREITVGGNNPSYCSVDGVLFNKDKTTLVCCPGGRTDSYEIPNGVTSIGDLAFYYCTKLTSVTIPDSVKSIGDFVFFGCKLTNVNIPDSVTSIGGSAFENCPGLTSVNIPDSVTSIGESAFQSCPSLTSVTIPNGVASIGYGAFLSCSNLTSVTIPDSVTSIGESAFRYCYNLTNVTIPNSVTSIGQNAFYHVSHITYHGTATGAPWGADSMN